MHPVESVVLLNKKKLLKLNLSGTIFFYEACFEQNNHGLNFGLHI